VSDQKIVFFDGVCNLCNSSVSFLIKKDKKRTLKYSSLQGSFAKEHLRQKDIECLESVVFLKEGKLYYKSEAVVRVLMELRGFYKFLGCFLSLFPYALLNVFYSFIAKNRYRFFGKQETCRVPSQEEKKLFID